MHTSVFELDLVVLAIIKAISHYLVLQVFSQILYYLTVLVTDCHPELQSEVEKVVVLLLLIDSNAGHAVFDVGHLAQYHIDDDLLPDHLDVVVVEASHFDSELRALGIHWVFPCWIHSCLEHLNGGNHVLVVVMVLKTKHTKL